MVHPLDEEHILNEIEEREDLEEMDIPSDNTSEGYLVAGEQVNEGYCVAFYDYTSQTWYSQETLEPVCPDEWWPLPSRGTGMTGESVVDESIPSPL